MVFRHHGFEVLAVEGIFQRDRRAACRLRDLHPYFRLFFTRKWSHENVVHMSRRAGFQPNPLRQTEARRGTSPALVRLVPSWTAERADFHAGLPLGRIRVGEGDILVAHPHEDHVFARLDARFDIELEGIEKARVRADERAVDIHIGVVIRAVEVKKEGILGEQFRIDIHLGAVVGRGGSLWSPVVRDFHLLPVTLALCRARVIGGVFIRCIPPVEGFQLQSMPLGQGRSEIRHEWCVFGAHPLQFGLQLRLGGDFFRRGETRGGLGVPRQRS